MHVRRWSGVGDLSPMPQNVFVWWHGWLHNTNCSVWSRIYAMVIKFISTAMSQCNKKKSYSVVRPWGFMQLMCLDCLEFSKHSGIGSTEIWARSSLLKLSNCDILTSVSTILSKSIFYLKVLRTYLSKELRFLKSDPYLTWDCLRRL